MTTKANKATAAEQWLDQLDPADPTVKVRDGRYLRHVREAADATDVAADDLRRAVAEIAACGGFNTIGAGAEINAVQIKLEDFILRIFLFEPDRENGFLHFA
jgi:hypothetical protein